MASSFTIPPNIPPPPDAPPSDHNPEALADIERGTFRNVDLESPAKPPHAPPPPPPPQSQPVVAVHVPAPLPSASASPEKTLLLSAFTSPLGSMTFKDQMALLAVFSLVVLIQSSINCADNKYACTEVNGFAVASGTISLGFAMLFMFFESRNNDVDDTQRLFISIFMFLWWASSMIALTFFGPFVTTEYANGYFGTWGGFIVATVMLSQTSELFRRSIDTIASRVSRKPVMYLLISSIVEVGSSIKTCIPQTECYKLNAFAIALGAISAILCIVLIPIMGRLSVMAARRCAVFFCVWWVVGGMIVTFVNPFPNLGNGYFSVFAAIISSFYLLQTHQ